MSPDEQELYDFLKGFPNTFVSATEISRAIGKGRRFEADRAWARPILRRMEVDGIIEGNPFGEYRVKVTEATETAELDFKQALKKPGVPLGDTTIIKLEDVQGGAAA